MIKKNIRWIFIFVILVASNLVSAAPMNVVPPGQWRANFWRFSMITDYFSTSANLSSNDIKTFNSLPTGNTLQVYELRPKLRYNLTNRTSFYVGGGFAGVNSISGTLTRSNSNTTEAFAGVDCILAGQYSRLVR